MAERVPEDRWVWALGDRKRLHEWVADSRCRVSYQTLYFRVVRAGWEPERAITTPPWGMATPVMIWEPDGDQDDLRARVRPHLSVVPGEGD
jgi:hypothetical protein